jgi:hypothetical protein
MECRWNRENCTFFGEFDLKVRFRKRIKILFKKICEKGVLLNLPSKLALKS